MDARMSLDVWLELDAAETDAWYRFRDLRDGRPSAQTLATMADERAVILRRANLHAIFTGDGIAISACQPPPTGNRLVGRARHA
jgi:hypothetical protein